MPPRGEGGGQVCGVFLVSDNNLVKEVDMAFHASIGDVDTALETSQLHTVYHCDQRQEQ